MAYALETITQADQEEIFRDAACDPEKHDVIRYAMLTNGFPPRRAIDRDHNDYLLLKPAVMREEWHDAPYYAFVGGRMYRINRVGRSGNSVYFDEPSLPSEAVLSLVRKAVTAAFSVYGSAGVGPVTKDGYPHFALVPEFTSRPSRDQGR
jgi:hypothetical protein